MKKIFAVVLSVMMLLGMLSMTAFADESADETTVTGETYEELGKAMGVDEAAFAETMNTWNGYVEVRSEGCLSKQVLRGSQEELHQSAEGMARQRPESPL